MKPKDRFIISTRLIHFPSSKAFLVKARGDGMEPDIKNRDMLICESSKTFQDGDFIAIVDKKDRIMIRRAFHKKDVIILQKMNPKKSDQTSLILKSELKVIGIVRQAIRNL